VRRRGGKSLSRSEEGGVRAGEARRAVGGGEDGAGRQVRLARRRFQAVRRQNARGAGEAAGGPGPGAISRRDRLFSTACGRFVRRSGGAEAAPAGAILGLVKSRQPRRQASSRFGLTALGPISAPGSANRRRAPRAARAAGDAWPSPGWTLAHREDERRITRLSAPAKTLSLFRRQNPHFFNNDKRLAGSAVDLLAAFFFRGSDPVNGARSARRLRRSKTIDRVRTAEGHAAKRSTAGYVAAKTAAVTVAKVYCGRRPAPAGRAPGPATRTTWRIRDLCVSS
jgi:hypothetical protein